MISVCLPTRERPEKFDQMMESALRNAEGDVEFLAVLDPDDDTAEFYPQGPTYITAAADMKQSAMWSLAWTYATGDIAHMGADDLIYRTRGWDTIVAEAFGHWRDRIGLVYVNDLNPVRKEPFAGQDHRDEIAGGYVFAANPFVSREWIEALDGFFTPPFYDSWEADTWLYQVAESISRIGYVGEVTVEHMHPMAGKSVMDATYLRGAWGNRGLMRRGWALTKSAPMRKLRREQADTLRMAIQAGRA